MDEMDEIEDNGWWADGELVVGADGDAVCQCFWNPVLGGDNEPVEAEERAQRIARPPALEAENARLLSLLGELVEYWDAAMDDTTTPEAVMMLEDAVRRARGEYPEGGFDEQ